MLADFNNLLTNIIEKDHTSLLVFTFTDSKERNKKFLSKIFNTSILNNASVKRLELNPITDANITKILKHVISDRGIKLSADRLEDIVKSSNRDLRNALQTLQFYSSNNNSNEHSLLQHSGRRHNPGPRNRKHCDESNTQLMNEESFFGPDKAASSFSNGHGNRRSSSGKNENADSNLTTNKDYGLSIFHALGKFLYNKRIDPRTKEPRVMKSTELSVVPKPESYINHAQIMSQVQTESKTFSLFLQENMYSFFNDVDDIAKALEVYSTNDAILGRVDYCYANQKYIYELEEQAALSEGLAITEFNIHGGDRTSKREMKKMAKPEWFDFRRKINETKQLIAETTKLDQLTTQQFLSADLLLSTTQRLATEYFPHMKNMGMLRRVQFLNPVQELTTFSRHNFSRNSGGVDESELVNDEQDKEFLDELARRNRNKQKFKKKMNASDGLVVHEEVESKDKQKYAEEEIEDSDFEINEDDLKDALEELDDDDISLHDSDVLSNHK